MFILPHLQPIRFIATCLLLTIHTIGQYASLQSLGGINSFSGFKLDKCNWASNVKSTSAVTEIKKDKNFFFYHFNDKVYSIVSGVAESGFAIKQKGCLDSRCKLSISKSIALIK